MFRRFFRGRRNRSNCVMAIIGILVSSITVGFALLSSALKIDGTVDVANAKWNIYFENIKVKNGSVAATQAATISDKTTISFSSTLTKAGDFYEFDVDVVNAGTLDAKVKEIRKSPILTTEQQKYLEYTVTYQGGGEVKVNEVLPKGERVTLRVKVKYKDGLTDADLPVNNPQLDVSYTLVFDQDDGTGVARDVKIDSINLTNKTSGKAIKVTIKGTVQDRSGLVAYAFTESADEPTTWTKVSGAPTTVQEFTKEVIENKTYYFHVKDGSNNTAYKALVVNNVLVIEEVETGPAAQLLINKANDVSVTTYTGNKGEMYTFDHNSTTQDNKPRRDYRYIGNVPNNYITFNGETWRIIGVFPVADSKGVVANRVKIIKDTVVADMPRDYKKDGVGSSTTDYGSNDWTDSQLMYFLNPDDIATNVALKSDYTFDGSLVKDANGTVIYEKGKAPAAVASGATTYSGSANNWRISSEELAKVESVKYYLGGTNTSSISAEVLYAKERGTTVPSGRPTSWIGKVGLMYPSDYVYTYANDISIACFISASGCGDSSAKAHGWLFNSADQWLLAPRSDNAYDAFYVFFTGYVSNSNDVSDAYGVRPVVYLKSDIEISGEGTSTNPYVIS